MHATNIKNSVRSLRRLDGYLTSSRLGDGCREGCGCPTSSNGSASYCCPPFVVRPLSLGRKRLRPMVVTAVEASKRLLESSGLSKAKVVWTLRERQNVPITRPLWYSVNTRDPMSRMQGDSAHPIDGHFVQSISWLCSCPLHEASSYCFGNLRRLPNYTVYCANKPACRRLKLKCVQAEITVQKVCLKEWREKE